MSELEQRLTLLPTFPTTQSPSRTQEHGSLYAIGSLLNESIRGFRLPNRMKPSSSAHPHAYGRASLPEKGESQPSHQPWPRRKVNGDHKHQAHSVSKATAKRYELDVLTRGIETDNDVVEFFSRHGQDGEVKFFYCMRSLSDVSFKPYELVVASRRVSSGEHFTVSASGVAHINPGVEGEFVPLDRWIREKKLFSALTNIKFFRHYRVCKAFAFWRGSVRHRHYSQVREKLRGRLFIASPTFSSALLEVAGHIQRASAVKLMEVKQNELYSLEDLAGLQVSAGSVAATAELETSLDRIRGVLNKVCSAVTSEAQRCKLSVKDEKELADTTGVAIECGLTADRAQSMVSIKRGKIERARTYRRVLQEEGMLGALIRLVDYMIVEGLVRMGVRATEQLLDVLESPRNQGDKMARALLTSTVQFAENGIQFRPDVDAVMNVINMNLIDGMLQLLEAVPRLLHVPTLGHFVGSIGGLSPEAVIRGMEHFTTLRQRVNQVISLDFRKAESYARILEELRPIHEFGQQWNYNEYAAKQTSIYAFRGHLLQQEKWRHEIDKMKACHVVGILLVDAKGLRSSLSSITSNALAMIKDCLLQTARSRACHVLEELDRQIGILNKTPADLDAPAQISHTHKTVLDKKEEALEECSIVHEMYGLLSSLEVRIPTSDQVRIDDLHERAQTFHRAIHERRLFLEGQPMSTLDT
eukprot:scaffold4735_cov403-Prasinococcus_capsulatus_cf.AAC.3